MSKYLSYGIDGLKYFAAHATQVGGIASALVLLLTGHAAAAVPALLVALSGFGVNVNPATAATAPAK